MKWLEVSISLSGELAEPVSDLFSRHAPGGVVIESTSPLETHPNKQLIRVWAFLPFDDQLEDRRRGIEEGLWHLSQIQELPQAQFHMLHEQDWDKAWKSHYNPINLGRRLVIQPAWLPLEVTDRLPIIIDPGMAFGTGTHPTTQLCLLAIEDFLQTGQSVIDIGCGSGILSIAAARIGAGQVLALDIDSVALQNARRNIDLNNVGHIVTLHQGSLELLLEEIPSPRVPAQLVVCNILTRTLEEMIQARLGQTIPLDGTLILSGILNDQVRTIQAACDEAGLFISETRSRDDWRAVVVKRIPPI
ncbi:MAG: ribosomal protein L11 methyltransferase [Chloroflexi bacterium RBG_16_48_8]|nr:MAG: ribosomal protein L11 methyltransferase [Chloroflexi bacterium RBG_16_48_8]